LGRVIAALGVNAPERPNFQGKNEHARFFKLHIQINTLGYFLDNISKYISGTKGLFIVFLAHFCN
jgi:hypothetical protein